MAVITSPTPDFGNTKNINEKLDVLLNSYYMLRKEIEYALQNVDFSNLSTDLSNRLKKINEELNANATNLNEAINNINKDMNDMQKAIEDGVITTYYQAEEPEAKTGDLWFNTSSDKLYRYNGTTFDLIEDAGIIEAVQAAQNAQDTADSKIISFYQNDEPISGMSIGDLWIDTNNNNKLYRYNGTLWQAANDRRIDSIVDSNGKLIAEQILGTINTAIAKVQNSDGKVTFDDRGLIVHNAIYEIDSNKAVLVSSGGILIANSKDVNGNWVWRTAITGDSINADLITTGTLVAINIQGVTITGSTITGGELNSSNTDGTKKIKIKDGMIEFLGANNQVIGQLYNIFAGSAGAFGYFPTLPSNVWFRSYNEDIRLIVETDARTGIKEEVAGISITPYQNDASIVAVTFPSYTNKANNMFTVANGTKLATIETESFGNIGFSSYETNKVWLGCIYEDELIIGEKKIYLDRQLIESCNTYLDYHVFITSYGNGKVWVDERKPEYFIIKGDNIKFAYEVKALRRGYETFDYNYIMLSDDKEKSEKKEQALIELNEKIEMQNKINLELKVNENYELLKMRKEDA